MGSKPRVAITMGDPAGIGSEIIVKAYPQLAEVADITVIGDAAVMERATEICESSLAIHRVTTVADEPGVGGINVLDSSSINDVDFGKLSEEYGAASLSYVERAIELAQEDKIDAIVTAPINKQATRMAGSEYAGHTGMLADFTDTNTYAMLLIEDGLRVSHVSTHVPLEVAVEQVTTANVLDTIQVTHDALRKLGIDEPVIAVAGINPHASDGGLLGDRDETEIRPAVEQATERGITAEGPESPDTVFKHAAQGRYDAVVAMYHDQGHIPVKMWGSTADSPVSGVNMTIGLPIIRTSVDHGTAFDIAGEGVASEESLIQAVEMAVRVATENTDG